jgi:hypothetical protein
LDFENVAPMKTTIVLLRKVDRIASQVVVVVVKVELDVDDLSFFHCLNFLPLRFCRAKTIRLKHFLHCCLLFADIESDEIK